MTARVAGNKESTTGLTVADRHLGHADLPEFRREGTRASEDVAEVVIPKGSLFLARSARISGMALGSAKVQQRFDDPRAILGDRLREGSIYRLLADHGRAMFPDDYFADCYTDSVQGSAHHPGPGHGDGDGPPGLRGAVGPEACDRLEVRPALAGRLWGGHRRRGLPSDGAGRPAQPTAGIGAPPAPVRGHQGGGQRHRGHEGPGPGARLDPDLRRGGHRGHRHPAARRDPQAAGRPRPGGQSAGRPVRGVLLRDDDYATPGKPPCDWDDRAARRPWSTPWSATPLALEALDGQSSRPRPTLRSNCWPWWPARTSKQGDDGIFRIVRKVAKDRVISTVDPEARHGHKSRNRHFDGYKAHLSIDPDSELIDEVVATPANTPDRDAVATCSPATPTRRTSPTCSGDSAYADGATRDALENRASTVTAKCPPVRNATGLFTKDRFEVDLETNTVTCPAGQRVAITPPVTVAAGRRSRSTAGLPDAPSLHQVTGRAHDHHRSPRGGPPEGPGRTERPRLGRALPGRPAHRRTQDRPLRAPALGRATRHGPEASNASPPTSTPEPAPSTGHDLPRSDCGRAERMGDRRSLRDARPDWPHNGANQGPHAPALDGEIPTPTDGSDRHRKPHRHRIYAPTGLWKRGRRLPLLQQPPR